MTSKENNRVEVLKWLIENHQKLTSFFIFVSLTVLILAWPVVAGVLYLERIGYFKNVYQEEHKEIKVREDLQQETLAVIKLDLKQIDRNVLENRLMFENWIEETAWQAKRTCINTAKTEQLRDECTKPKWRRDTNQ